ncbi:MAG TPA: hypothetical protein VFU15_15695 [Bacteroidia bacterium]|nr:hypothetical protein [Bacteroidia bacterium]
MKKHYLPVFVLAGMMAACSGNNAEQQTDHSVTKAILDTQAQPQPQMPADPPAVKNDSAAGQPATQIACYYFMGNSSHDAPPEKTAEKWVDDFISKMKTDGLPHAGNVFLHNGAGPMGAEWNPHSDLLVAGFFEGRKDTSDIHFFVDDFNFDGKTVFSGKYYSPEKNGVYYWFSLTEQNWNVGRHLPSDKEKTEICAQRNIPVSSWVDNTCTVARIAVTAGKGKEMIRSQDYFIVAFGE